MFNTLKITEITEILTQREPRPIGEPTTGSPGADNAHS